MRATRKPPGRSGGHISANDSGALRVKTIANPILKERLFGLTNSEGNHGEDVKEYYFYLDSTRASSRMMPTGATSSCFTSTSTPMWARRVTWRRG